MAAEGVYAIVGNIPASYHSSHLRNYFSQFLETGGFQCFHFRHRPEIKQVKSSQESQTHTQSHTNNSNIDNNTNSELTEDKKTPTKTMCCVIRVQGDRINELIAMYHGKHWLDDKGEAMPTLCFVSKIKITDTGDSSNKYMTRGEQKTIKKVRPAEEFSMKDLDTLIELKPPDIMPNGNIGTPTRVFLDLIQACKLPPGVINKLGLTFPKTRSNKRYGNVPFDYEGSELVCETIENQTVTTAKGHILTAGTQSPDNCDTNCDTNCENTPEPETTPSISTAETSSQGTKSKRKGKRPKIDKSLFRENIEGEGQQQSDSDSDDCEDWERHEVLHDDAANAERNKERLYEEELEIQWEKGGSGLVFYTDAQYWKEQEGDFDEQTADDWDVDMEIYTDPYGGDKDAQDLMTMRTEKRRRKGITQPELDPNHIGQFEKHTKGVGRKVMERQGWREGEGLGSWKPGMSQALENEGQAPGNRAGLGYTGEKLQRYCLKPRPNRQAPGCITTIYDNPADADPQEPLLRRQGTHHLKHRANFVPPGSQRQPHD